MSSNNIELKSITELVNYKFFIPNYQRGYRWTKQQVKDLLNDIFEFQQNGSKGIYCIQPLVVRENDKDKVSWDVIDGQQRLTTIFILLSYLKNENKYSIEYETRKRDEYSQDVIKKYIGAKDFLNKITNTVVTIEDKEIELLEIAHLNIDFHHMYQTYKTIKEWFEGYSNDNGEHIAAIYSGKKNDFLYILMDKVKFIWYKTNESNPIKVFTRLNIGKIALTDAELIKALFLNSSNFKSAEEKQIRLEQIGIASEWDKIECTLQNDEFWLFINNIGYSNPTRIDYIFDLIRCKDIFKLKESLGNTYDEAIGNDEHKTFRYFYEYFKREKQDINAKWLRNAWQIVKEYFQVFEEWYNDIEMYHYVGYLIYQGKEISELKKKYEGNKDQFKLLLNELIEKEIKKCSDLNRDYGENGEKKTQCRPLLLLFNIQTVINQNNSLQKDNKYELGVFYKFPFHLYKKEGKKDSGKGWEVEHIASNAGDDLDSYKNQKIWLAAVLYGGIQNSAIETDIKDFLNAPEGTKDFWLIQRKLKGMDINPIEGVDKQKIWNFALLDSSTNEEYQNDPFPIKRICVLSKEQGWKTKISYNEITNRIEIDKSTSATAFVPPCTKSVFTKAYTDIPKSLSAWSKDDAEKYKAAIYETLKHFKGIKL